MSDRYRLVALGNDALVAALSRLVLRENELLSDMLAHLAELDERRLYLELGFSSMFAYCTDALGLCKSSAYRRIAAARVCRQYPEVFVRVAAGELQTSVLAALSRYLTAENAAELFEACSRKSCEQVEEILACRFPKPDVADSVRRLPARCSASAPLVGSSMGNVSTSTGLSGGAVPNTRVSSDSTLGAVAIAAFQDVAAAEPAGNDSIGAVARVDQGPALAEPVAVPVRREMEPLSHDRFGVRFTANGEFKRLLEQVRALASHRYPNGDLSSLMMRGLEAYRRELLKERFGVGRKARGRKRASVKSADAASSSEDSSLEHSSPEDSSLEQSSPEDSSLEHSSPEDSSREQSSPEDSSREQSSPEDSSLVKRSRHVPAAVAREVYLRDGGRCTFHAADGRRCGARRFLEIDHTTPWAAGGESTAENLRLRCHAHNVHAAREYFGGEYVRRAVTRARRSGKSASPSTDGPRKAVTDAT